MTSSVAPSPRSTASAIRPGATIASATWPDGALIGSPRRVRRAITSWRTPGRWSEAQSMTASWRSFAVGWKVEASRTGSSSGRISAGRSSPDWLSSAGSSQERSIGSWKRIQRRPAPKRRPGRARACQRTPRKWPRGPRSSAQTRRPPASSARWSPGSGSPSRSSCAARSWIATCRRSPSAGAIRSRWRGLSLAASSHPSSLSHRPSKWSGWRPTT